MEVFGWGDVKRTVLAPPQPDAGSGVTATVPESQYQTLIAVTFQLATSATVADRTPVLTVQDGSGVPLLQVPASVVTAASDSTVYTFAAGIGAWDGAAGLAVAGSIPAFPLDGGDSILVTVDGIDTTDQLSQVRVTLLQRPVREG